MARYDGIAEWYDEQNAAFMEPVTAVIARLLGPGPGRCLEVGCGGGLHLPALVELGWAVTGVDAGVHPCFCGPFIRYRMDDQIPNFVGSYRDTAWKNNSPAFGGGIRSVVGAKHVPLADFLNSFLDAGFTLERFDEPGIEDYPRTLVLAARR